MKQSIAVIGMFDGVHQGHRYLLGRLKAEAELRGLAPRVVTFANHPLDVIAPDRAPRLLTDAEEKIQLLGELGVETDMLDFTDSLRRMPADGFMQLLADSGVKVLLMGFDNRFGHDAPRDFAAYQSMAAARGIEIIGEREFVPQGVQKVSSSEVRSLVAHGDIEIANSLLEHTYRVCGTVVHGQHNGTSLGFPTANIEPRTPTKLIPARGVYSATALVGHKSYKAMVNVGCHPTLGAASHDIVEAHLIGFSGDIYGCQIAVEFSRRLRPERRFPSLEALKEQLRIDMDAVIAQK